MSKPHCIVVTWAGRLTYLCRNPNSRSGRQGSRGSGHANRDCSDRSSLSPHMQGAQKKNTSLIMIWLWLALLSLLPTLKPLLARHTDSIGAFVIPKFFVFFYLGP